MPRKYQPWSRGEYDRLEELVKAGWRYADIAENLDRGLIEVRGAAQRIGLTSRDRQGWRGKDWSAIDTIIVDCVEARLMTAPQVAEHLKALGTPIPVGTVYRRLETMPHGIQQRARRNGSRRRAACCARMRQRQKRTA